VPGRREGPRGGAFRRSTDELHEEYPELLPIWYAFRDNRAQRRTVEWLLDHELIDQNSADSFFNDHPDPNRPDTHRPDKCRSIDTPRTSATSPMLKLRTAAEKIYAAYTRHPGWARLRLPELTAEISKDADDQTERYAGPGCVRGSLGIAVR
jgi:hypothetical protein